MTAHPLDRLLRRLHRSALELYPRSFRERFAVELDLCLADLLADARARGRQAHLAAGLGALLRALLAAPRAWRQARRLAPRPELPARHTPEEPMRRLSRQLGQDVRFAVRRLARAPGFVLLAVVSLAVGVGANTTMLATVDGLIWRRLPVPDAERIVRVVEVNEYGPRNSAYGNYQSLVEEASGVFDGVSVQDLETFALDAGDSLELAFGELVSSDYFQTLRLEPAIGRFFTRDDAEAPSQSLVVVLAHDLWKRAFSGDPGIVGSVVRVNDQPATVVAVAPAGFEGTKFALGMDLWVPARPWGRTQGWGEWETARAGASWHAFARLRPEVTPEQAQASLDVLAARLADEHPETNASTRFAVLDERVARITPEAEGVLWVIAAVAIAASTLVLLVACVNVGGLLLTRAAARRHEVGLRAALGAGRTRLVGELLVEGAILAALGGAVGVAVALSTPPLMLGLLPSLPYRFALDLRPSPVVIAGALVVALAAVLLSALAPALRASRVEPATALGDRSPRGRRGRGLDLVVVAMTALAFLSLTLGTLFFQTLSAVREIDPGFATDQRLLASFDVGLAGDPELTSVDFTTRLLERASALPGVEGAAVSTLMPLGDSAASISLFADDRAYQDDEPGERAWYASVTPGWLEIAGTSLLEGRGIEARDDADAPTVAVINRTLAERLWPGGDWIGRRVRFGRDPERATAEVVGVMRDGRYEHPSERPRPAALVSFAQTPRTSGVILLHAAGVPPESLATDLRQTAREVDPRVPLFDVRTVDAHVASSLWLFRTAAGLASALGLMALLLATAGVYGAISYRVGQRTRELGVRLAIGARTRQLFGLVLRGGLALCATGVGIGLLLALIGGGALRGVLVGVAPHDPRIYLAVALVLALVSVVAALRPALRAARVDPVGSLRMS
ncbi:MAG TPA: ADOP family duplicated permease [Thermoanaerobaculia bacterium]|nr:ADOP family duplicated permease [Thermoanaerobaculia bacterium]